MSDDSWSKVKEILQAAIQRDPGERSAYIDDVCGDDPEIRREVESLLSSFKRADGFMEGAVFEAAAEEITMVPAGQMLGHYEMVRRLGEGGMGIVYLARDAKLDRLVAVKVLNIKYEHHADNIRRFVREAKAASALNHPNILTIFEIGEFEGSHYIVSEYIEGHTLRDILKNEKLGFAKIVDIAGQTANALATAHKARIIHRDIKPENIIVREDGYVKVLDFGLAKLLPEQASAPGFDEKTHQQNTTASGIIMGTVNYMSPEQAKGEKVDERTDVFSLGVVLYEMITGKRPFVGNSAHESFANLINKQPDTLETYVSGVPAELQMIVSKMLRKERDDRYQTMQELAVDLKELKGGNTSGSSRERRRGSNGENLAAVMPRTTGGGANTTAQTSAIYTAWRKRWPVAVISIFLFGAAGFFLWNQFATDTAAIRSLAVLPLKSLDAGEDHLGFGIADAVIRRISQTGKLTVRPTSAVRRYLGEDVDALTAARKLQADAILEGTVQRSGERLRISVNLLRTSDGASLWAQSFDTQMSDIFVVQDNVSKQIAETLQLQLDSTLKAQLTKRTTSNPVAYEYYIKGVYSYDQRGFGSEAKANNDATIELFKKAIDADPRYALAHARLAQAAVWQGGFIVPEEQEKWFELAKEEIKQADILDDQLAETHLARVWLLFSGHEGYQIAAAAKEVLKAQEINPSVGHGELADLYIHLGLEDLFEREFQHALEIDPTSEYERREFMISYALLNRWDDYLALKNRYFPNESISAGYYLAKRDIAKAEQAIKEEPTALYGLYKTDGKALLLALKSDKKTAEAMIPEILKNTDKRRPDYHHVTYDIATVYAINGNVGEAVKWLSETVSTGNPSYEMFARDPFLDRIRQSPEFIQFMAELKPQYEKYRSEFH